MPQILVYLSEELNEKIKNISDKNNSTKSDVIINLISRGLEGLEHEANKNIQK